VKKKKTNRRSPKRRSHKNKKKQYRIRNWPEYNAALVQRGSLTVWLDDEAVDGWHNRQKSGGRGASCTYTDSALVCALTLQMVYHLPLRATEGLLLSLFGLLELDLSVPDFSTLCRRRKTLPVQLSRGLSQGQGQAVHLVVDSTGLKVYGEGEWKVRQHGWSKRRTWRKLHLGIDEASGEVLAALGSGPERADKEVLEQLLAQVEAPVAQVSGDGGYDAAECYGTIAQRGARATIPPRRNARLHEKDARWQARNANLLRIRELQGRRRKDTEWGRKQWKQESGYHRRSLAETGIMRLKTIFGGKLGARDQAAQDNELLLRCRALNRMTQLGMPQSYAL
jgi:IS5 family transposase